MKKSKSLNRHNQKVNYPMKKRGQFEPVSATIGAIFVLGLIILGGVSSYKVLSQNRYVGDNSTGLYFDLSSCVISIEQSKLFEFESKQDAETKGYQSAPCNR